MLVAEMLGDIGKLHDQLAALNEAMPGFLDDVDSRLTQSVGMLVKAGSMYEGTLKNQTMLIVRDAITQIRTEAAKARADAAAAAKHEIDETVMRAMADIPGEVIALLQAGAWRTVALCFGASMFSSLFVLVAFLLLK
ncbi:hypothetical protein [Rhodoferax sp. GW822-FHT02A01]|uniref:hypothetical protein n=1 Tax=Rhodoferax sp. GW822-FHT02A01 TaxID=3141537 RepID=UPI00315D3195